MLTKFKKAATLVEILAATVILTLVATGITSTFLAVRRYVRRANEQTILTSLSVSHSRSLLNRLRADTWNDPASDWNFGQHALPDVFVDGITYSGRERRVLPTGRAYRRVEIEGEFGN